MSQAFHANMDDVFVRFMERTGQETSRYPDNEDNSYQDWSTVIDKIGAPTLKTSSEHHRFSHATIDDIKTKVSGLVYLKQTCSLVLNVLRFKMMGCFVVPYLLAVLE